METRQNGNRFDNYYKWGYVPNAPYDYRRNGLLKHLMSKIIVDAATNEDGEWRKNVLGTTLNFIETSFVFLMKYTERLQNFKNYAYTNR